MAQDLNTLLTTLQELNRAVQAGQLTREQLEVEVKRVTKALKESLADLGRQLPPEAAGASAMLVDVFKMQLGAILRSTGLVVEESEEMKKLSEELELIKRSYIRS
ncbi:hypothetical protein [Hyalangium gracile]|uniref:hypothetical protein n=1 Tax=Hyalangium gracile TaxID=394092 RepID=UPI001CCFF2AC|nr:hypothetical protein [Hyalangium gracile]